MTTFAKFRIKIQARLRLTRLPERSYEEAVATALGQVEFSGGWMQTALSDPNLRVRSAERDARWYTDLFTYISRGYVPKSLNGILDIASGSRALSSEAGSLAPRRRRCSTDPLAGRGTARRGSSTLDAGRAADGSVWRFAHPDFVRPYLDARAAVRSSKSRVSGSRVS